MKSYTFASAAASVLAGAALLSGVKADVDPIVIKVRADRLYPLATRTHVLIWTRDNISSTRPMEPSSS